MGRADSSARDAAAEPLCGWTDPQSLVASHPRGLGHETDLRDARALHLSHHLRDEAVRDVLIGLDENFPRLLVLVDGGELRLELARVDVVLVDRELALGRDDQNDL